ncbi:MAG: phage protease [Paracoccaceae bacterium]
MTKSRAIQHASKATLAMMAMASNPDSSKGAAPDWVHLLPSGQMVTQDGRGPYSLPNPEAVLQASLEDAGGRMVVDENHATDTASKNGHAARAAGWITELQSRDDGIWGRVEWTKFGLELMADKSYRGVSPVIMHDEQFRIGRILRASLTNAPNLKGLASLHMETDMEFLKSLAAALGLSDDASEADVLAAVKKALEGDKAESGEPVMQAAMQSVATHLGVAKDAKPAAIIAAIDGLKAATADPVNFVPVSEFKALQAQHTALASGLAKERAEAVVDAAIKAGKANVKPLREHFIARHMASTEGAKAVELEIAAMISLSGTGMIAPQSAKPGEAALDGVANQIIAQMGIDPDKYAKALAADRMEQEAV